MVERWFFLALFILLASQRIYELRLSRQHEEWIRSQGGIEVGAGHFRVMQILHILWFISMLAEVFLLGRSTHLYLAIPAFLVFLVGQFLRYAAILTLGKRWTVRIFILPGKAPIESGIYRWIRHPNYLGVILEIAAFPMIGNAFLTALIFSIANAVLLAYRIRMEEHALETYNHYRRVFAGRPRFFALRPFKAGSRK